jgi:hypothetical protein
VTHTGLARAPWTDYLPYDKHGCARWYRPKVSDALLTVLVVASLAAATGFGVMAALGRRPRTAELAMAGALEAVLLVTAGVLVAGLVQGDNTGPTVTIVVYLVGTLMVMPLVTLWALAEPTRWSTAVLAAGALVVCLLALRIDQVWSGA